MTYYLLASFCSPDDVERSVQLVLQSELSWDELSPLINKGAEAGVSDGGKLVSLLGSRRRSPAGQAPRFVR